MLTNIFLIGGAVCFGLAAFAEFVRVQSRVNLIALGLLLWILVDIINTMGLF